LVKEATDLATRNPSEAAVPLLGFRRLLSRAIALTGEPAIGMHCGLRATMSSYDAFAPLVWDALNLRAAIGQLAHSNSLRFDGTVLLLTERAGIARLRWKFVCEHDATDVYLAEYLTACLLGLLRRFGYARRELYSAHFEHGRPAHHYVYTSLFDGRELFSEGFTGLEFDAALLNAPHPPQPADRSVAGTFKQLLAEPRAPQNVIDRLQDYMRNEPSVPEMSVAARSLGMSSRSLSRRLAEAGLSYRMLTREAQCERACAMLCNPDLTLKAVGDALSFSHIASFHRAFKRWTGRTAGEYRGRPPAHARGVESGRTPPREVA
jgi:AraC-like DNA-binding protein